MHCSWRRFFARLPMARSTRAYAFALEQVDLSHAVRVLEIGTGQGFGAAFLSRALPQAQVYSVDIRTECLKPERLALGPHPPHFIQATAPALPLAWQSMDAAFLVMTFHCLPQPQQVIREAARVLKPGGVLILADVDGHHWMARPFEWVEHAFISPITRAYTPEAIQQMMADAGLTGIQVKRRPGKEKGFMMWVFGTKP